ncbi:MAG: M10 family metallopeptidase C-terminal domain-containing protein, partial [Alphaproteobacteria bacterium]|nr:M10 family metallopeptidase C-terminal domain-containing protein [Alphaproteobacteria bacterium]
MAIFLADEAAGLDPGAPSVRRSIPLLDDQNDSFPIEQDFQNPPEPNLAAPDQNPQTLSNGGASGTLGDEVTFISGVNPDGTLAFYSFAAWNSDKPATYTGGYTLDYKWGDNAASTPGGTVDYYFDPASNWTAAEEQVFIDGLALWSAEANIQFALTGDSAAAQITFTRGHDGKAYTSPDWPNSFPSGTDRTDGTVIYQLTGATISIDTSVAGFGPISANPLMYGGYPWLTAIHEEGHVLGLGHAGPYNGTVASSQQYSAYDTRLWSVMSYLNNSSANAYAPSDGTSWNGYYPTTPMIADILAAERLYGSPLSTPLSGGQTFGFNTNISGDLRPFFDFTINTRPVITLWDEGAGNTLDLSGFSSTSTVNLNAGCFSSCDGMTGNLAIAQGTAINILVCGNGNDSITCNAGGDTITAGAGNDIILGGAGDDILQGGAGNDAIDGGSGTDAALYAGVFSAYSVTGSGDGIYTVSGPDGTDTLSNVEKLVFADQTIQLGGHMIINVTYDPTS